MTGWLFIELWLDAASTSTIANTAFNGAVTVNNDDYMAERAKLKPRGKTG
jgi:hypothetical protein